MFLTCKEQSFYQFAQYFCRRKQNYMTRIKHTFLLFVAAVMSLHAVPAGGQNTDMMYADTLATDSTFAALTAETPATCCTHRMTLGRVAVPAALLGIGIWGVGNDWMDFINREVREEVQENIDRKLTVDDYMQYAPAAATLALGWCGVKARHTTGQRLVIMAMATAIMGATVTGMKHAWGEMRPDGTSRTSFPSGHTATAFMGAEMLRIEYGAHSPWIAVAGYSVAAGVGFFRVYNNRHWLNDIIAGAGLGMLSTRMAYWLYPKVFGRRQNGRRECPAVVATPYYGSGAAGVQATILF